MVKKLGLVSVNRTSKYSKCRSFLHSFIHIRWQKWNNLDIYGFGAKIIVCKEDYTVLLSLELATTANLYLDPNPDPDPPVFWILLSLSKNSKKKLDFYCFVTSF
jgi:hypothetical protein